ncbi:flagellar hook-associated protein FlgL [Paraburkholderia oxyphila]|uniref:flagellar hook-associated protein FlgL n=1 Tax=Paraburkholderia oxyphila TaxID=614212 RepID=UPI00048218E4|nr:flagellar hook-associated protein FlgL [Paraburkholderia oxyphila]
MRIATSQLYSSSLATMENQQAQLLQVEQQVSSGVSLSNPADNPLGAAQAVQLSATSATLTQYQSNQSTALSSLQLEDSTLSSVTSTLQAINQQIQSAVNGSLSDSDRQALAQQLQGERSQLLTLANTTDGQGNYLFSGFQSTSQVFTNLPGGGVQYNGDSGQRLVQVAGSRQIQVGDTGSSVFMSVSPVGSSPVSAGSSSNTGTGTIGAVTVTDATQATNSHPLSIQFATDATTGALTYSVKDDSTNPPTTLSSDQPYTDGSPIDLGASGQVGMTVAISGTPAAGDTFSVTPATAQQNSSVFSTIDNVIAALQQPVNGSQSATANLTNALTTGLTALGNSISNVITVQASVGGREQELQALQTVTSNNSLQVTTSLSTLTSTDMTAAITQYTQISNALSASQKSFAATQNLSLFQYINP